jgi:flagellar hook-associated protein 1 FlgK
MDFSALHVALSGLRAAQLGIDTTSHNVSNASTEGFTRQRVDLATRRPRTLPMGQLGTGVDITDITRARNSFLDARVRSSLAGSAETGLRASFLARAETVFAEPDLGISAALEGLFDSFEELSLEPTDMSARSGVLAQLDAVALRINQVYQGIEGLRADARSTLTGTVAEVNDLLGQVAQLNVGILETAVSSGSPNDLMDKRDLLVDRLSQLLGVRVSPQDGGSIQVSLGGVSLVSGSNVRPLTVDAAGQILHPSGLVIVPGGEIRGLQAALVTDLPGLSASLDALAVDLATAFNAVHGTGFHAGGAGADLFGYSPAEPAKTLARVITNPAELATATTAGPPFPAFDGTIAERLAGLRTTLAANGGTTSLPDALHGIVVTLGREVSSLTTASETQVGLAQAAERARMSVHGVSVDEEMVSLMEYQRMYEAAARVITAVDQSLDTLINRTGLVGR